MTGDDSDSVSFSKDPVSDLIRRRYGALPPELQRCARWANEHRRDVALLSMRQQALLADATPTSMTRLARALGFEDYAAFRKLFQDALAGPVPDFRERVQSLQAHRSDEALAASLADMQAANVRSALTRNSPVQVARAIDLLLRAKTIGFLGLRSCFATSFHFWYVYNLIGRNGLLVHGLGGAFPDDLGRLGDDDLLVCITQRPYGRPAIEAVRAASRRDVAVLTLTDSPQSPAVAYSTETLLFEAASPSYFPSMVGSLALVEGLLARLAIAGGGAVLDRLAEVQGQLASNRAYWDEEGPAS
jgi:DNA-binding MurR/RpiR family transcriptional regulator